jgi:hypothetical protein
MGTPVTKQTWTAGQGPLCRFWERLDARFGIFVDQALYLAAAPAVKVRGAHKSAIFVCFAAKSFAAAIFSHRQAEGIAPQSIKVSFRRIQAVDARVRL